MTEVKAIGQRLRPEAEFKATGGSEGQFLQVGLEDTVTAADTSCRHRRVLAVWRSRARRTLQCRVKVKVILEKKNKDHIFL